MPFLHSMKVTMRYLLALLLTGFMLGSVAHAEILPRPDHVVVVIEENRSYSHVMRKLKHDPYIHSLIRRGMLFTQSYAVAHPSQPNYLALFSGSTQGIFSNDCPNSFSTDNLATRLLDAGLSFGSYSQSLPAVGDLSCYSGAYWRKHNPMANWQGTRLPAAMNMRFSEFPADFAKLPTVSFVIPDQEHDMHDGSFATADEWLRVNIAPYVDWAMAHNSLLILTWDEDNGKEGNHIVTIMVGPMVRQGTSGQFIDHYSVLRTLLDFYDLPALGASRSVEAIRGVWK